MNTVEHNYVLVMCLCAKFLLLCKYYFRMELNLKDAEEITYESQKQVAIKIMRTNLPEYVVNCFVAAGFDTLEVIADMDTSGEPGNSLQLIEDFINNEHPGNTKFTHGTTAASTFKFPPGHRQSIAKFVQQTKLQEEEMRRLRRKRENGGFCTMPKRWKTACLNSKEMGANNSTSSSSTEIIDQSSLVADIRRQVAKWQRSQQDSKLRELTEHEKYEVRVKLEGGKLIPSIQCNVCTKSYSLGLKGGRPLISNWTKHLSKCMLNKTQVTRKLQQYFQPTIPLPSTSGDVPPFTDQQSVHEETNPHFWLSPST